MGGNKTRQLEFVFADIPRQGCDTVVAGAYTQSNWCRQMTAASRKLGLEISVVLLHGEKGPKLQGNLLLMKLLGADVTVDLDTIERLQPFLEEKATELPPAAGPTSWRPWAWRACRSVRYVAAASSSMGNWQKASTRTTSISAVPT